MVSNSVLKHKGQTLTYHQCLTIEEAKENELPEGIYFFWTLGSRKIINPLEAVQIVLNAAEDGNLDVQDVLDPRKLKTYYETLHQTQINRVKKSLIDIKKHYTQAYAQAGLDQNSINEMQKNIDKQLEQYDNVGFPGIDGLIHPSRKEAEAILGGKENINKFMSPELQRKVFGG
jgi:uncharacterized protein YpiB (UPF0302 family)